MVSTIYFAHKHRDPAGHCDRSPKGCCIIELKNLLPQLVAGILSLGFLLRIAWCFVEAIEYASRKPYNATSGATGFEGTPIFYVERVMNRLSMLLLLTSFSLVLLGWLLSAGGALKDWNKCFRVTFVIVNVCIYIVTLSTVSLL